MGNTVPLEVRIDKNTCIGCGVCWSMCPDVFEMDAETGKSKLVSKFVKEDDENKSVGTVSDEFKDCVSQAASSCPTGSITTG